MDKSLAIFNRLEEIHLGKDVVLIPLYLKKKLGGQMDLAFEARGEKKVSFKSYRGINLIKLKRSIFEVNLLVFLFRNSLKYKRLILFHFNLNSVLRSLIFKNLNKKGKVYVKLDIDFIEYFKTSNVNFFKKIKKRILANILYYNTDIVSVESCKIYDYFLKEKFYGIDFSKKVRYIANGFDTDYLMGNNIKINEFKVKEDIIVFIGRLGSYQKNAELFLEALKDIKLEHWKVYFIGSYTEAFKKKFNDFILLNSHFEHNIEMKGPLEKKVTFDYLNRSKIFVLTSRFESYGLVLNEALMFRNYILSTDVGAVRDLTKDFEIGKEISTKDDIKNSLEELIGNQKILEENYKKSKVFAEKISYEYIIENSSLIQELK